MIGVVLGEGDGLLDAYGATEDMAVDVDADAVIDVRTTAVGAGDGTRGAQIRWARSARR